MIQTTIRPSLNHADTKNPHPQYTTPSTRYPHSRPTPQNKRKLHLKIDADGQILYPHFFTAFFCASL